VDKIGEILRAYLEQARLIKEIVRTLSVSRATVRKGKAAPIVPPCLRIPPKRSTSPLATATLWCL
jgi:hypothetical protein